MKKQKMLLTAAFTAGLVIIELLIGCNVFIEPHVSNVTGIQRGNYEADTQTGKVYQDLLDLTVNAVASVAEKVFDYDQELLDNSSPRSINSGKKMDIMSLLSSADLTKTKDSPFRSVESSDGLTLEKEIGMIVAEYEKAFQSYAIDDLSFLEGLPGVFIENGLVVFDGDLLIDPQSMSGIMELNLIKAALAGEDVTAIIDDMDMVVGNYPSGKSGARSAYYYTTPLWPNGIVFYCWGDISPTSKSLFEDAMADWQTKVPSLQFVNLSDQSVTFMANYLVSVTLKQKPLVALQSNPSLTYNGQAYVGARKGRYTCTIRDGLSYPYSIRTPRHELAHTLGLEHEHQRWDRDLFLQFSVNAKAEIARSNALKEGQWNKIVALYNPDLGPISAWLYIEIPINVQGVTIYVYYLVTNKMGIPSVGGTVEFDYRSIMLYSSKQTPGHTPSAPAMTAKVAKQGYAVGDEILLNSIISEGDIATVSFMY